MSDKLIPDMTAAEVRREIAERHLKRPWHQVYLMPDWTADLNAAWVLWEGMGDIEIRNFGNGYEAYISNRNGNLEAVGLDPDPALAISRAALAWLREAQK